jgi:hypothetical protein
MNTKKIIGFTLMLCLIMSLLISSLSVGLFAAGEPDLVFTDAKITSKTDSDIGFQYTIKNNGASTIPSLYNVSIQCFYSDNTIFYDSGDVAAGGSVLALNRSLAPGESYTGTFRAYGSVPSGKNYLVFKVDWGNIVYEADENNNTSYISTLPGTTKLVDLRPEIQRRGISIRNQGGRGTCPLFALTFLYEYQYTGRFGTGNSYNDLSEEFLNYWGQTYSGGYGSDGTLYEYILKAYKEKGVCAEASAPYISSNWTFATFQAEGTKQSACDEALVNRNQYSFSAKLWWSADTGQQLIHNMDISRQYYTRDSYPSTPYPSSLKPVSDEAFNKILSYLDQGIPCAHGGGHCRDFVGYALNPSYAGGGYFIIRNSYGITEGDQGYDIVSFDEIKNSGNFFDFVVIVPDVLNPAYYLEPQCAPGMRLDVNNAGNSNGTNVWIWGFNGTAAQRWKLIDVGGGYFELEPQCAPGMRLDVNNAGNSNGTNVWIWGFNGTAAQRWKLIDVGGGYFELEPQCAPGMRLDVNNAGNSNGTNVWIWACNSGWAQRWRLIPVE